MNPLRWLVDFFGFSHKEAGGVLVLIALILCLFIFPKLTFQTKKPENNSSDSLLLAEWVASLEAFTAEEERAIPDFKEYNKIQLASDLRKNKWEKPAKKVTTEERTEPILLMDLNEATAEDLQAVRGIGPVLSERIVKFRNRLGGFHSVDQLRDVYGLDTAVVSKVRGRFEVASAHQKTLFINADSIKAIASHPYLEYKTAKAIFYYRKTHGDFTDPAQLLLIKGFSDSLYQKIYPYISIQPPTGH